MKERTRLSEKLKQRDFKLNALLEMTKAINANLAVDELLERFERILRNDLQIEKMILFVKEENWKCILKYGVRDGDIPEVTDERFFSTKNDIKLREESFDLVIPISQDDRQLAYLLLGDLGEEQIQMSPVVKHMNFIQTLTNVMVVAIENRKLVIENLRQERIKNELELAAEMQAILLPNSLPKNKNFEVSSVYRAHQQVGGDYYDFLQLNEEEFMFCMADVSGKGVSAAFLMANFQAYLRAIFSYRRTSLEDIVKELNARVMDSALGEKYITLFIATYNSTTRKMQFINCGHNPPVLADRKGYTQLLKLGTIGLGMFEELPHIAMGELEITPNSTVVCYTDGLVETENEAKQEYGIERLEQVMLSNNSKPVAELNRLILQSLNDFKGDMVYMDDLAMLTCRFF